MNYSLSKKIFSLNCRLDLNDSMFCEILKEELDLYPESSDNPNIVFTFTNSTKKFEFTLTNPKVHLSGKNFFGIENSNYSVVWIKNLGDHLLNVHVYLKPAKRSLKQVFSKFRNIQFTTFDESAGQVFHEVLMTPSVYFFDNLFLIHGSALVSPEGDAVIFGGTGGTGKTSSLLALGQKGWKFLSDDICVLDNNGNICPNYAYPKIYAYNTVGNKELEKKLLYKKGVINRFQWHFFKRISLSRVRRRIAPDILYEVERSPKPLKRYYILSRGDYEKPKITKISPEVSAEASLRIIKSEYWVFNNHLYWHEFNQMIHGNKPVITSNEVFNRWLSNMKKVLSNVDNFLVEIPRTFRHNEFLAFLVGVID